MGLITLRGARSAHNAASAEETDGKRPARSDEPGGDQEILFLLGRREEGSQAAHMGSVEEKIGMACDSVVGHGMPMVPAVPGETRRPPSAASSPTLTRGERGPSIRYSARGRRALGHRSVWVAWPSGTAGIGAGRGTRVRAQVSRASVSCRVVRFTPNIRQTLACGMPSAIAWRISRNRRVDSMTDGCRA